jgi:hypothetical protein
MADGKLYLLAEFSVKPELLEETKAVLLPRVLEEPGCEAMYTTSIDAEPNMAFDGNRIAVRFVYESHDASGHWFRCYGNENWEFDANGLMTVRHASINDLSIKESDRLFRWPQDRRPDDHRSLSELGL